MPTVTVGTGTMQHPTLAPEDRLPDSADKRFREAEMLLREGARRRCDFFCLPELFADPSQGTDMARWAEPEGGQVSAWLGTMAARHEMAIVTTVARKRNGCITNTGVIFDKSGTLAGSYDKVHLPEGEREAASPGADFPVFEVHGIRVGMQICHDLYFPEGCRILALRGADIVFWPNMWGGMPESPSDIVMRARAIDNTLYLVSAAFVLAGDSYFRVPKILGRSCVIDPAGTVLAEVGYRLGVASATLELADAAAGTRTGAARFPERLPHLYTELVKTEQQPGNRPADALPR